ncbi:hypothetical protein LOC68_00665 [Blastopirellula sp. JC732]|uniref:Uncharacterized protein n=1 Tax=Blastopirellula sediminis TaxID=2894196 RepID=A0A9X1SEU0_9BACT|nr:hypothetical protein [Blastopirellula sediminis]MCC9604386.1 hypothetical protein [Blastopirellula sediminis]MCC9626906.1 hypothetical protein [Blastopirellula sediminis]
MSIKLAKLRCPRCGKSLGIPRKLAGKTTPCPKCGESFTIADDLSRLITLTPPTDEEPIVAQTAEAAEPPLAMSVEKPEGSRFPWLIVVLGGLTIMTLLVIVVVVISLPSTTTITTPTELTETEESEPAEAEPANEETEEPGAGEEPKKEMIYDRSPQPVEPMGPME